MRVLYVEDDPAALLLVQKRLGKDGIEVVGASSPTTGMDLLKKQSFDALILDIMMPGIDGIQIGRYARKEGQQKDIPIILLTAHPTAMRDPKARELRPVASLTKPVQWDKLLAALNTIQGGKKQP